MRVAVKRRGTKIGSNGKVMGREAGDTLVRRFLRVFPDAQIIADLPQRGDGFDVITLAQVDPEDTVIVNFDVVDSPAIWEEIFTATGVAPKVMNFVSWPLSNLVREEQQAAAALSCGLFPTFANSRRTAGELEELVNRMAIPSIAERAKLGWVNLGFRLDHVVPKKKTSVPVVLYPAIYLGPKKRPELFMEIVERVHDRTPLLVEMRLEESALVSERAMKYSRLPWVWVSPLTSTRDSYWEALSKTTAMLATASSVSYGLIYVEALGAGVIGVFPDDDWARALLPKGYPYFYRSKQEAEEMLYRAVTAPDTCREEIDAAVGVPFQDWVYEHHSDTTFDEELRSFVASVAAG